VGDLTITGNTTISGCIGGIQYCGAGTLTIGDGSDTMPIITASYEYTPFPQKISLQGDGTVRDGAALSIISRGGGYQNGEQTMTVIINNATLTSSYNAAIRVYRLAKVNGVWVTGEESGVSNYLESLSILKGTLTGAAAADALAENEVVALEIDETAKDYISITGGTFSSNPSAYVDADTYTVETISDTSYKVTGGTEGGSVSAHSDANGDGYCDHCGQVYGAYLKSRSLTLEGNIAVNYYVYLDVALRNENTKMTFTVNGVTTEVPFNASNKTTIDGKTCYRFSVEVTAKQMADKITAELQVTKNGTTYTSSGDGEKAVYTYSVATYGENMKDKNENVKQLVTALLNYGTMAQNYFGYNTGSPANSVVDKTDMSSVTPENLLDYQMTLVGSTSGIAYKGATLVLESETSVRYYFQLTGDDSIKDYIFTAVDANNNKVTLTPEEGTGSMAGRYYVQVSNISAQNLDARYTVTVTKADDTEETASLSITYGPLTYAYNKLNSDSSSANIQNLVKALYLYNQAAQLYFVKKK
jgi:hypothetical protein